MDGEQVCWGCAGPVDPETGECVEHRDLMDALGRLVAGALDRYQLDPVTGVSLDQQEQAALASRPLPYWPPVRPSANRPAAADQARPPATVRSR